VTLAHGCLFLASRVLWPNHSLALDPISTTRTQRTAYTTHAMRKNSIRRLFDDNMNQR